METTELLELCGISNIVVTRETVWAKGTLRFLGADGYVLRTKNVEFTLRNNPAEKGFSLVFKKLPRLSVGKFFGVSKFPTVIHDVMLRCDSFELSLATTRPGLYPQVLRNTDTMRLI